MVNREIRSSGTTWTGMTLHTLFTTSGKKEQIHLPFKASTPGLMGPPGYSIG